MFKNTSFFLFLFLYVWQSIDAQSFTCDGKLYITGTGLTALTTQALPINTMVIGNEDLSKLLIGYNIRDNYIYGFHKGTHELYRINALGKSILLGKIANIDPKYTFKAAEITPNGRVLLLAGRGSKGYDEIFYQIPIDAPPYTASFISLLNPEQVIIEDMAFSPSTGELYGLDSKNNRLITITRSSTYRLNTYQFQSNPAENIGALLFDKEENLFALGASGLSKYDLTGKLGAIQQKYTLASSLAGSGASCPYSISLKKSIIPQIVAACGELTITYEIINKTGENQGHLTLTDTLPKGFVIAEVVKMPYFSKIIQGSGTNILHIVEMSPSLGRDSVVVKVKTQGVAFGSYASQAVLETFPVGLGITQRSDDPTTPALLDATSVSIVPLSAKIRQNFPNYICYGDSVKIDFTPLGCKTLWSDGSTLPKRYVTKEGWMKVTVDCGCTVFSDSFFVQKAKAPLEIDVENAKVVNFGESTPIAYTTVANGKVNFLWKSSSAETTLSCIACSEPQVIPYKNALISVTITDENTCKANDSMQLTVVFGRKIFSPNVFSPNNDGDNDIFYLQGQEAMIKQFTVINRWGNIVFRKENIALNDSQNGWNGIFKGDVLPQDTYIWVAEVEFLDKYKQVFSGAVTLFH